MKPATYRLLNITQHLLKRLVGILAISLQCAFQLENSDLGDRVIGMRLSRRSLECSAERHRVIEVFFLQQVCLGEPCSRCLYACPVDAVLHWHIDKRRCATEAQEYGFSRMLRFFHGLITAPDVESTASMLASVLGYGIWQGLLRVVGAFGDCPRCLAVCPVGDDYLRFLSDGQRHIPEKTADNVTAAKAWGQQRQCGAPIPGLQGGRIRWIGELGYRPPGKAKRT